MADLATIEQAFATYDVDGSGYVDASELAALIEGLGGILTPDEMAGALAVLDSDGSGKIEKNEFIAWWNHQSDGASAAGSETTRRIRKQLLAVAAKGKLVHHVDIHVAAWKGEVAVLRSLLEDDEKVLNAVDQTEFGDRNTPLHYAAYNGHLEACELLLERGADKNATNEVGCTPLFYAAQQNHEEIVKLLLERGARVDICEKAHGFSPIDVALNTAISELCVQALGQAGSVPQPPAPPTSSQTKTGIAHVRWQAPPRTSRALPIISYRMVVSQVKEIDGSLRSAEVGSLTTNGSTTTAQVRGLASGLSYAFQVAAVNSIGESELSEFSAPLTIKRVPAQPDPPTITRVDPTGISLSWTESESKGYPITEFHAFARHENEEEPSCTVTTGPDVTNCIIPLKKAGTYYVAVAAANEIGCSFASEEIKVLVTRVSATRAGSGAGAKGGTLSSAGNRTSEGKRSETSTVASENFADTTGTTASQAGAWEPPASDNEEEEDAYSPDHHDDS